MEKRTSIPLRAEVYQLINPIKVAIIGTGNIGTDLLERMHRDSRFEVVAFVGRRKNSANLQASIDKVSYVLSNGIDGLIEIQDEFEGFFDATSASDHKAHWDVLSNLGKWSIDLTPSQLGSPLVPVLVGKHPKFEISKAEIYNYSMVTCGGQSSAPIIHAITKNSTGIQEVEVSSSIAADSAGPATRRNIDQYIASTENLVKQISGCLKTKAMLVLNPSNPPVMMRTTAHFKVENCNLDQTRHDLEVVVREVQKYVPKYQILVEPHVLAGNIVSATVGVEGEGYFLPSYAGNLDIINAAAVETAFLHASMPRHGDV